MKSYKTVKSTLKPEQIKFDDYSVYISTNIKEVKENIGTENEFIGYQYDMVQYSKDEYIILQNELMTNTELALTELYETILGSGA